MHSINKPMQVFNAGVNVVHIENAGSIRLASCVFCDIGYKGKVSQCCHLYQLLWLYIHSENGQINSELYLILHSMDICYCNLSLL